MLTLIIAWCVLGTIINFVYCFEEDRRTKRLLGFRTFLSVFSSPIWPIMITITSPERLSRVNPFYYLGLGLLIIEDKIKGRK